jgi:hypothetical protein
LADRLADRVRLSRESLQIGNILRQGDRPIDVGKRINIACRSLKLDEVADDLLFPSGEQLKANGGIAVFEFLFKPIYAS